VYGALDETDRIMRDTFFVGIYAGLTPEMIQALAARIRDCLRGATNWRD